MCLELICSHKVACSTAGTHGEIVFSLVGISKSRPITHTAVLLKTTGLYTLELRKDATTLVETITKQGTGELEFCLLKDLILLPPDVYSLDFKSTENVSIYEINLATRCLCS